MLQKKKKYEEKNEGIHMWATVDGKPTSTTGNHAPPFHLASCRHLRYMRMSRPPITPLGITWQSPYNI